MSTRILAIVNQKGGVGNLAAALAKCGQSILLIDLDPQGNASTGLGVSKKSPDENLFDVFVDNVPLEKIIKSTVVEGVDIAPSHMDMETL